MSDASSLTVVCGAGSVSIGHMNRFLLWSGNVFFISSPDAVTPTNGACEPEAEARDPLEAAAGAIEVGGVGASSSRSSAAASGGGGGRNFLRLTAAGAGSGGGGGRSGIADTDDDSSSAVTPAAGALRVRRLPFDRNNLGQWPDTETVKFRASTRAAPRQRTHSLMLPRTSFTSSRELA